MAAPTITDPPETAPGGEPLIAGSSFARYQIVRCIGVGGMGAVFEATHQLLRKRVALKALHATLGRSDASRARFLREAETVARIRHPNVVDITDVGIERGIPFLVMEFLEGEDLASVLEREGQLEVTRAVDLLLPAVAGLCAVHRLGIVHRDVKPENIFLARDPLGADVPKLVDFGVSKDLDASGTEGATLRHTVAGTPYYMAPEQARGAATLDGRADQYAMAVVLYQCLARARPFNSDSLLELLHMIDAGDYVPLRKHNPDVPEELAALIARAMSHRLEERFPTTEAFGQSLAEFASEEVRKACARDFSAERRSALPPLSSRWSQAERERLSAPTRVSDEPVMATINQRPSKGSGVLARDTASAVYPNARSRRAFLLAFGATLILLLVVGFFVRNAFTARAPAVKVEPRSGQAEPARATGPLDRARSESEPAHADGPAEKPPEKAASPERESPRVRAKPRREETGSAKPPALDIQLSR